MTDFSIVCPVKDEVDLIPVTLPSFYAVSPTEVLLCLDKPAPTEVVNIIRRVAKQCDAEDKTRVIEVERNPEYRFHQAWVRRKGFLEANYDRILTTDIDLIINRNVLKAVEIVGKDNIGLVSLSKLHFPRGLVPFLRLMGEWILKKYVHRFAEMYRGRGIAVTTFTGLYAIWRPYWLDSEDEGIKRLVNPKQKLREGISIKWSLRDFYAPGEDTYLRDCMEKKHRVVYLPDIGAIVLSSPLEDHPDVQYMKGIYFALKGRNLVGALARAFLRLQPYYLCGHLYGKRILQILGRYRDESVGSRLRF